jgi:hypothetical protein
MAGLLFVFLLLAHAFLTLPGFFLYCFSLEQIVFRDSEHMTESVVESLRFRPAGNIRRW